MSFTVAFTAHRPDKLGGYGPSRMQTAVRAEIRARLIGMREVHPDLRGISGMALGGDTWAAEAFVELGIPFTAAVPFTGQELTWPAAAQEHYRDLLKAADRLVIVTSGGYSVEKMYVRNRWMVRHSDLLIAIWNGSAGGTAHCVNQARLLGRTLVIIDPNELCT